MSQSFSHFVPRLELIPEKRLQYHGGILSKIAGSTALEGQVRRLMPDIHVFGHTHIPADITLEGVRYIQWPLGNPREQEHATHLMLSGFMKLFDATQGGEAPQHFTALGAHYEEFERDLA